MKEKLQCRRREDRDRARWNSIRVTIHTARPGIVIGRKGAEIEKMTEEISKMARQAGQDRHPGDQDAGTRRAIRRRKRRLADRAPYRFRRAMKKAVQTTMDFGAQGIDLRCAGRLGGAEIRASEWYREGKIPLHTLRTPIDYGFAEANTVYGNIGVKCWICKKEEAPSRSSQSDTCRPRRREPAASLNLLRRNIHAVDAQTCEVSQDPARKPRGHCFAQLRIDFGAFGLQTLERAWITNTQIEAARVALTRNMKRKGKLWIRIFPDKSVTARPPETRMGKGKGQPEYWVATVRPGNILFELDGVPESVARESLRLAADKLPVRTKFLTRASRRRLTRYEDQRNRELSTDELLTAQARTAPGELSTCACSSRAASSRSRASSACFAAKSPASRRCFDRKRQDRAKSSWPSNANTMTQQTAPVDPEDRSAEAPQGARRPGRLEQDGEDHRGRNHHPRAARQVRQDREAGEEVLRPRRGEQSQDRRHGSHHGDPPAQQAEALARWLKSSRSS